MNNHQVIAISKILGSMATDDGQHALLKFSLSNSSEIAIAIPKDELIGLMQLTSHAAGECQKKLGSDRSIKHIMDVEWWEVGGTQNNQNVVMSYRMTGGIELSFRITRDAATHLHEALGVHLGIASPDQSNKPTN